MTTYRYDQATRRRPQFLLRTKWIKPHWAVVPDAEVANVSGRSYGAGFSVFTRVLNQYVELATESTVIQVGNPVLTNSLTGSSTSAFPTMSLAPGRKIIRLCCLLVQLSTSVSTSSVNHCHGYFMTRPHKGDSHDSELCTGATHGRLRQRPPVQPGRHELPHLRGTRHGQAGARHAHLLAGPCD
jgi:hypothetical protein